MVRKLPNFVQRLFGAIMGFLLDVEDDPLWHKGDSDQVGAPTRKAAAQAAGVAGGLLQCTRCCQPCGAVQ
jgi:hypothetical protein